MVWKKDVKVATFYPSSKTCSSCGNIKETLKLSERIYHCECCGLEIDRDYNASINILRKGLEILKEEKSKLEKIYQGRDYPKSLVNICANKSTYFPRSLPLLQVGVVHSFIPASAIPRGVMYTGIYGL